MKFSSKDQRFKVVVSSTVLEQMVYYAKCSKRIETGGILIGAYSADLDCAMVSLASGPPSDSKAGQTWFYRGVKGLDKLLKKCFANAGTYYLGEWHFHPFASPSPSGQDLAQMKIIASDLRYNCPEPIMLILGGDPSSERVNLCAYVILRSNQVITLELSPE